MNFKKPWIRLSVEVKGVVKSKKNGMKKTSCSWVMCTAKKSLEDDLFTVGFLDLVWPGVKNKGRVRKIWMRSSYALKSSEPGYIPTPTTLFPTPSSLIKGWTRAERLTLFWLKGLAYIFRSSTITLCEIHSIWFWSFYTLNSEGKKTALDSNFFFLQGQLWLMTTRAPRFIRKAHRCHSEFTSSTISTGNSFSLFSHILD